MRIVYSEEHKLRNPRTELHGGALVPPYENPGRMDRVLEEIARRGWGPVEAPSAHGLDPVRRVHDADYLDFLSRCWRDWSADPDLTGEAIAMIWPSRAMPRLVKPRDIEGEIGYYALAADTAISEGTWEAARASADVALSAASLLADAERAAFALCRPPGHHAASGMFGGYCFLNNAAIAAQSLRDAGWSGLRCWISTFIMATGRRKFSMRALMSS